VCTEKSDVGLDEKQRSGDHSAVGSAELRLVAVVYYEHWSSRGVRITWRKRSSKAPPRKAMGPRVRIERPSLGMPMAMKMRICFSTRCAELVFVWLAIVIEEQGTRLHCARSLWRRRESRSCGVSSFQASPASTVGLKGCEAGSTAS
jgi:hypothetical protein